jgi:hypothetical protein
MQQDGRSDWLNQYGQHLDLGFRIGLCIDLIKAEARIGAGRYDCMGLFQVVVFGRARGRRMAW